MPLSFIRADHAGGAPDAFSLLGRQRRSPAASRPETRSSSPHLSLCLFGGHGGDTQRDLVQPRGHGLRGPFALSNSVDVVTELPLC